MTKMSRELLATRSWVEKVVIGENFCPFAKPTFDDNSIRYHLSDAESLEPALVELIEQCHDLDEYERVETILIVYRHGFSLFNDFLDLIDMANALMAEQNYEGIYQLAHFHPDYCFEDTGPDDAENFTNRSPYPTLHLIREASIERVLKQVKAPENIPERNIRHANKKGNQYWHDLLKSCLSDDLNDNSKT